MIHICPTCGAERPCLLEHCFRARELKCSTCLDDQERLNAYVRMITAGDFERCYPAIHGAMTGKVVRGLRR